MPFFPLFEIFSGCCFITFANRADAERCQREAHNKLRLPNMNRPVQINTSASKGWLHWTFMFSHFSLALLVCFVSLLQNINCLWRNYLVSWVRMMSASFFQNLAMCVRFASCVMGKARVDVALWNMQRNMKPMLRSLLSMTRICKAVPLNWLFVMQTHRKPSKVSKFLNRFWHSFKIWRDCWIRILWLRRPHKVFVWRFCFVSSFAHVWFSWSMIFPFVFLFGVFHVRRLVHSICFASLCMSWFLFFFSLLFYSALFLLCFSSVVVPLGEVGQLGQIPPPLSHMAGLPPPPPFPNSGGTPVFDPRFPDGRSLVFLDLFIFSRWFLLSVFSLALYACFLCRWERIRHGCWSPRSWSAWWRQSHWRSNSSSFFEWSPSSASCANRSAAWSWRL